MLEKKVVCMPIVDVTQELKKLVKEKETPNEYNWLGSSSQQFHLCEGGRIQETNTKQRQQQISWGISI